MMEKTQQELIQETHDSMIKLETKLPFMQEKIEDVEEGLESLDSSHSKLKRNFWLLVGILAGSGVIGGGAYGLFGG